MLPQEELIARVRELCQADEKLVAALTYGSFPQGQADAHSDIEFWLFFRTDPGDGIDRRAWLGRIAPNRYAVMNEFGTYVVFFPDLIRGEFHFATAGDIASVATWPSRGAPVDRMIVLDRTGELRRVLESLPDRPPVPSSVKEIEGLCGRFANWLVLAHHVSQRGELLRAIDALSHAQRHLLWIVRIAEGQTAHWLTPSRQAEVDLDREVVAALHATAAPAEAGAIGEAIAAAWECGRRCWLTLADRVGVPVPRELFGEIDVAIGRREP